MRGGSVYGREVWRYELGAREGFVRLNFLLGGPIEIFSSKSGAKFFKKTLMKIFHAKSDREISQKEPTRACGGDGALLTKSKWGSIIHSGTSGETYHLS
jgi:hypothetical protein